MYADSPEISPGEYLIYGMIVALIIVFIVTMSGCGTLTQTDKDYFDKEYKHYKQHKEEPREPRP
jgi:hypothetical protein